MEYECLAHIGHNDVVVPIAVHITRARYAIAKSTKGEIAFRLPVANWGRDEDALYINGIRY